MKHQAVAASPTTMYRYMNETGLDFMLKKERDEIIFMLSLLQEVAKSTGEGSPRRSSKLGL